MRQLVVAKIPYIELGKGLVQLFNCRHKFKKARLQYNVTVTDHRFCGLSVEEQKEMVLGTMPDWMRRMLVLKTIAKPKG